MKITAIPQLYRNLRRWREILAVLRRYGLADWLTHFHLPFRDALKDRGGVPLSNYSREQRVRMALTDLGPTFIKLGQVLAGRPDLVGPALGEELKRLRINVPPDPIEKVRATLREELGEDYQRHFRSIDPIPLATASIGQVHRAELNNRTKVVIKVQRQDIDRTMRQDVEVLVGLAQLAKRVDALAAWGPSDMVRQLAPMIMRELDFTRERQNLEHFAEIFRTRQADVVIPRAFTELCTQRVLVMDELLGQPLEAFLRDDAGPPKTHRDGKNNSAELSPEAELSPDLSSPDQTSVRPAANEESLSVDSNESDCRTESASPTSAELEDSWVHKSQKASPSIASNRNSTPVTRPAAGSRQWGSERENRKRKLSETIASVYLTMLFDEAMFHADPHSGNLVVMDDGLLGILDFGMVGRIDEALRETIEEMLVAISSGDQHRLMRLIRRIGDPPPTLDESALAIDVAEFIGTYGRQSLGSFDMTGALNDLSALLHRHSIRLPNQSALLLKMLISLEGTLRELGASFDSLEVVRKFVQQTMVRRLSPKRRIRQARRIYLEAENFLEAAPDEVISLLRQARRGEVRMTLEHQRLGPTVNRMVLGLMASAVFLGSALMLAMKVPPLLFPTPSVLQMQDISLLGLIGVIGSMTVMMGLLLAINRSGHLTRDNDD
ncbi:MAG: AarF/UbiB family protein [Planctomycetota bacterium]|nr:AarF/UbiB family protein [Planctomycetota bacterium]